MGMIKKKKCRHYNYGPQYTFRSVPLENGRHAPGQRGCSGRKHNG